MTSALKPDIEIEREVRFAVVMYGGLSLAIYINGVAQEMLRMVRATAAEGKGDGAGRRALLSAGDGGADKSMKLSGTERVYRKVSYMLSEKEDVDQRRKEVANRKDLTDDEIKKRLEELTNEWIEKAEKMLDAKNKADSTIRTRFIVDILSGTSAGGINGIYLAKALANGQDIDQLKQLWVKEGDIALLINDKKSVEHPFTLKAPPASLLNSERMYVKLLRALDGMQTNGAQAADGETTDKDSCLSPYVEDLDLFVTTTDIHGVPLPIRLADTVVNERRHRNVFHFVYSDGGNRNDFMARYNPFLAYAARCTSAFPVAFEPMRLCDIDDILKTFPNYNGDQECRSGSDRWKRFFKEYLTPDFAKRSFGDGGYLDNKPFSYATEALMRRHSSVPVDRKLIYIEPSPENLEGGDASADRPDVVENVMAAAFSIPRYETIREDLKRVLDRNRLVKRVNRIIQRVERDIETANHEMDTVQSDEDWAKLDLTDMVRARGVGYVGYHRLDIASVTDDLARLITRLTGFDEESDYLTAIRSLARVWRDELFSEYRRHGKRTLNEFLWSFNLAFPLRRISFLRNKIDRIHRLDERGIELLKLRAPGLEMNESNKALLRQELRSIKAEINKAYQILIAEARLLRSSRNKGNPMPDLVTKLGITSLHLDYILGKRLSEKELEKLNLPAEVTTTRQCDTEVFEEECALRAEKLLKAEKNDSILKALIAAGNIIAGRIKDARSKADAVCRVAVGADIPSSATASGTFDCDFFVVEGSSAADAKENLKADEAARACLRHYYEHYDEYDMIMFPILYGTDTGETDVVEIIRISPEDATSLINEKEVGCVKLAGNALGHFGAFMEEIWRENDIMWGRLDGAERIITALLPGEDYAAKQLVAEAQAAIVCETIKDKGKNELNRLMIESMMRTRDNKPDVEALSRFICNIKSEALNEERKKELDDLIDDKHIRDFYIEHHKKSSQLTPGPALKSAARASTVVGQMLEGLSDRYQRGGKAAAWVTRLGKVFWGLVEVAVPDSIANRLARHWLKLLYFFEALMIVGGILLSLSQVQDFGWKALGLTLAIHMAILLLTDMMSYRLEKWRITKTVIIAAFILLIVGGLVKLTEIRLDWRPFEIETAELIRGVGVLGLISLCMMIVMALRFKHEPEKSADKKSNGQSLPGGFKSWILAMELVTDGDAIKTLVGERGDARRARMEEGLVADAFFIGFYWLLFIGMSILLFRVSLPTGDKPYLSVALGVVAGLLATLAAVFDIRENRRIFRVLNQTLATTKQELIDDLRHTSITKWIFVFATIAILSTIFFPNLLRQMISDGSSLRGFNWWNVIGVLYLIGAVIGLIASPVKQLRKGIELAFIPIALGFVAMVALFIFWPEGFAGLLSQP